MVKVGRAAARARALLGGYPNTYGTALPEWERGNGTLIGSGKCAYVNDRRSSPAAKPVESRTFLCGPQRR